MSTFSPIQQLNVFRRLQNGQSIFVGQLAQDSRSVFFQYDSKYLQRFSNLSPFKLGTDNHLQTAPTRPHQGLHGVFADSLPDGWGLLLMDRVFRQHSILPQQLTAMDRLAYVGHRGMGALEYSPVSTYGLQEDPELIDLARLGEEASQIFEGHSDVILAQLAYAGSSGGARPKAQVYFGPEKTTQVSTLTQPGYEPWLVKFTSGSLALGHEEGLCEAAYLTLAAQAGIDVPQWQLFPAPEHSQAISWLAQRRFDCTESGGRYHVHSIGGLLDADFRMPSLDYEDLIKASQILCQNPAVGQTQFKRAIFNLFAANQDDHSKNWAFLLDDTGQWSPAPFYDVTFSPNPHGEHSTAFMGYGKRPPLKVMQKLAQQANFSSWPQAQAVIQEVLDTLQHWNTVAKDLGVRADTRKLIQQQLDLVWWANKGLLVKA